MVLWFNVGREEGQERGVNRMRDHELRRRSEYRLDQRFCSHQTSVGWVFMVDAFDQPFSETAYEVLKPPYALEEEGYVVILIGGV